MLDDSIYRSLGLGFLSKITSPAIYVTDVEGRVLFWNCGASELFGWDDKEVLGATAGNEVVPGKDWKDVRLFPLQDRLSGECDRQRMQAVSEGLVINEQRYVRRNESHFLGMSLLMPLYGEPRQGDGRNGPCYFLRIVRDISDQERSVARLEKALDVQNHVSETLKSSQLPVLPENTFAGLRIAALYHPTHAEERVGGDLYDAMRLSDGGIAVFVGDASGKGIRAATRAAEVRYSLRAFLREDPDPARAVTRVNNVLCQNVVLEHPGSLTAESMMFTTLTLAVIYPERREMRWVHAGGEFPLLFSMDNTASPLTENKTHMMLGISPEETYTATTTALSRGDIVLLFTDGVTESRRAGVFFGTDGITHTVNEFLSRKDRYAMNAHSVAEEVLNQSLRFAGTSTDDMCLLAVQLMD